MEFCCPPLPGASRRVKGSSHMCWILPSVLGNDRVEEQEPLVSSLWWVAEVTVAVAVFWDFLGAFHHKCAFLSHARLMSRTLTSIWWVQITKIELIRIIINGLDFYSKTMSVALGTATWLKCIFTGAFSACLWTFKADLNWVFEQSRSFSGVLMALQSSLPFLTRSKRFASRLHGCWIAFAAGLINGVCLV